MLILDLWGISFHTVVVFALGKNLLFKSVLGHCLLSTCCENATSKISSLMVKALGFNCHLLFFVSHL